MDNIDENIYDIERLTHEEVRRRIGEVPAVIFPLGGCEPFGAVGEVGAESACALEIARELSRVSGILIAPLLPFSCSGPFISFAGAAAVKPHTFVNMLCDILHSYVFQGINRIFLVNAAPFNWGPADEVMRRMTLKYPGLKMAFFDINTVLNGDKASDLDRDDGLILSLLSYIRLKPFEGIDAKPLDKEEYKVWKRRGRDPQKFQAICPDGLMLPPDSGSITPAGGKELFERIVSAVHEKIKAA
ncbi:MAG: creatininase family protein [Chitinispirillia bacterium]|nr:creatininase family protein [Chitinispirillia bacterium]MCL2184030.1 creatininase family protein [Chitinispirillia bacterium]